MRYSFTGHRGNNSFLGRYWRYDTTLCTVSLISAPRMYPAKKIYLSCLATYTSICTGSLDSSQMKTVSRKTSLETLALTNVIFVFHTTVETTFLLRDFRARQTVTALGTACGIRIDPHCERLKPSPSSSHLRVFIWLPTKVTLAPIVQTSCVLPAVLFVQDAAVLALIDGTNASFCRGRCAISVTATAGGVVVVVVVVEWTILLPCECIRFAVVCVRQLPPWDHALALEDLCCRNFCTSLSMQSL